MTFPNHIYVVVSGMDYVGEWDIKCYYSWTTADKDLETRKKDKFKDGFYHELREYPIN